MIFLIKMMSGQEIPIENEAALKKFLNEANKGKKLVMTTYGVVNVNSVDSIIPHKKKLEDVSELLRVGKNRKEAEEEVLGKSPFAELLSPEQKKLEG